MVPGECRGCKRRLRGHDSEPRRHQVVEVPPLSALVTEYRCHALKCPDCGVVTRGEVPAHARSAFGDRLAALASLLVGKYRLSKRLVKHALSDMLGVELSVGSVSNLEGEISQALAPAAAEALTSVRASEERMRGVERKVGQLLRKATLRAEKKTAGMARELLQWEKCLWTFVDVPGLEPTNNFGECCIRHAVMYRKTSFGTQSEEGSRFVERIFTATSTLKLQGRDVLAFLADTLAAHRRGLRGPSLLPTAPVPQLALTA